MKKLISKLGMTREDFANAIRVSIKTVDFWCNYGTMPSEKDLKKISKCFGLDIDEVRAYV